MGEIHNLIKKLTDAYVNPKATNSIDTGDNWHYSESRELNKM